MLASFAHVPGGAVRTTAQILLIGGFAVKAGLVPFQVWLPRGYAAAPGPARAIMAGVCVNLAFYGMWRTFALIGRAPGWLTGGLLVLGALSALLGIAHAAVQDPAVPGDRLLQHREHRAHRHRVRRRADRRGGGRPAPGHGRPAGRHAAGGHAHRGQVPAVHLVRPGIEAATGADDLEELRGGRRRTPWSGFGLAVGSLTLAGLPPTVGFVSEWFLLESLMQQFRVPGLGYRLVLALAGAAVALTVGFAGVTFVRLVGLVVLGRGAEVQAGGGQRRRTGRSAGAGARLPRRPRRSRRWRSG